MYQIFYLTLLITFNTPVYSLSNNTANIMPETFATNFISQNGLWSDILKNCMPPTFDCIKNYTYNYLKRTIDDPNDIQFTSFLKFIKNSIDYSKLTHFKTITYDTTKTSNFKDNISLEEKFRLLAENAIKFFMTHDVELHLPDSVFLGTNIKISPKSIEENGALVKLEIMPKSINNSVGEGRIFFKKIKKFISERLIYALLAILLVVKLLAVKILFVLPTIVGVATAKKLLLKVLLFLFPALHHLFKLCAYVPHGAKHHIHKHQISHIHEISYDHHHPRPYHKRKDSSHGLNGLHHISEEHRENYDPHDTIDPENLPYFVRGNNIHRKDLDLENNDLSQGQNIRPTNAIESGRPLTLVETENMLLTEKERRKRLHKQQQMVYAENLRLQERLNNVLKIQKYKQAGILVNAKISPISIPPNSTGGLNQLSQINEKPYIAAKYPTIVLPVSDLSTAVVNNLQKSQLRSNKKHHEEYDYSLQNNQNSDYNMTAQKNWTSVGKPNIHNAATITYDPFYSPILKKIDEILKVYGLIVEPCKEQLICSMYKNPSTYSPYSNLLSVQLSRESKDLQKPTSTNSAIIKFYKYVQAARDGQDKRDCTRLYPSCNIDT